MAMVMRRKVLQRISTACTGLGPVMCLGNVAFGLLEQMYDWNRHTNSVLGHLVKELVLDIAHRNK